jgi:3-(3-hydroxy-phenyl)propionate hydroxylase
MIAWATGFAAVLQPDLAASLPAETVEYLEIIIVDDDSPEQQAWLQTIDAPAVLVRPDRYVLGAARSVQELHSLAAAV